MRKGSYLEKNKKAIGQVPVNLVKVKKRQCFLRSTCINKYIRTRVHDFQM